MTQPKNPFRYFDSSPEVIRLVVMMYVRYPLSLRNVEDLLAQRGHCQGKQFWPLRRQLSGLKTMDFGRCASPSQL